METLPLIVGFMGKKGAGKDTASQAVRGYSKIAFGDAVKDVCKIVFGLTDYEMNDPVIKERVLRRWPFESPRRLMQKVGTDMFRNNYPLVWIKKWEREVFRHLNPVTNTEGEHRGIVVPDVRFYDEANAVWYQGGIVIKIVNEREGDKPTGNHVSECEHERIPADLTIINDCETAHLFRQKVAEILKKEFNHGC